MHSSQQLYIFIKKQSTGSIHASPEPAQKATARAAVSENPEELVTMPALSLTFRLRECAVPGHRTIVLTILSSAMNEDEQA